MNFKVIFLNILKYSIFIYFLYIIILGYADELENLLLTPNKNTNSLKTTEVGNFDSPVGKWTVEKDSDSLVGKNSSTSETTENGMIVKKQLFHETTKEYKSGTKI